MEEHNSKEEEEIKAEKSGNSLGAFTKEYRKWLDQREWEKRQYRRQMLVDDLRGYLLLIIIGSFALFIVYIPAYFLLEWVDRGISESIIIVISLFLWVFITKMIGKFLYPILGKRDSRSQE